MTEPESLEALIERLDSCHAVYEMIELHRAWPRLSSELKRLQEHKKLLFEENWRLLTEKESGQWDKNCAENERLKARVAKLREGLAAVGTFCSCSDGHAQDPIQAHDNPACSMLVQWMTIAADDEMEKAL